MNRPDELDDPVRDHLVGPRFVVARFLMIQSLLAFIDRKTNPRLVTVLIHERTT